MKNKNFEVLSKDELQETVGGGLLNWLSGCFGGRPAGGAPASNPRPQPNVRYTNQAGGTAMGYPGQQSYTHVWSRPVGR